MRVSLLVPGRVMAFLAVFLVLSGGNTGNNLLFLVGSAVIGLLILSLGIAYLNLRGLHPALPAELGGFAGAARTIPVTVTNTSGTGSAQLQCGENVALLLGAGEEAVFHACWANQARGRYEISDLALRSSYPFGLVGMERTCPPVVVWNYPVPDPSSILVDAHLSGSILRNFRLDEGEFWSQREYQFSDDARRINWTVSARSETEWVSLHAAPRKEPLRLWVDPTTLSPLAIEPFVRRLTALVLSVHAARSTVYVWCGNGTGTWQWVGLDSPHGLTLALQWLAILAPSSVTGPLPPEATRDSRTHRLRPEDFDGGPSHA